MYVTYEKPGAGIYACIQCRKIVILSCDSEELPLCSRCEYSFYEKLL